MSVSILFGGAPARPRRPPPPPGGPDADRASVLAALCASEASLSLRDLLSATALPKARVASALGALLVEGLALVSTRGADRPPAFRPSDVGRRRSTGARR